MPRLTQRTVQTERLSVIDITDQNRVQKIGYSTDQNFYGMAVDVVALGDGVDDLEGLWMNRARDRVNPEKNTAMICCHGYVD